MKLRLGVLLLLFVLVFNCRVFAMDEKFCRISKTDYIDKVKGGWLGQIAGVAWGFPTEFAFQGKMMSEGRVPVWKEKMINEGFCQDDLYVADSRQIWV